MSLTEFIHPPKDGKKGSVAIALFMNTEHGVFIAGKIADISEGEDPVEAARKLKSEYGGLLREMLTDKAAGYPIGAATEA